MLAEILETPEDEAGSGSGFWIVIQRLLYSFTHLHCAMARSGSDYFIVKVSSICSKKRFTSNLSRDTSYYAMHRQVKKKL